VIDALSLRPPNLRSPSQVSSMIVGGFATRAILQRWMPHG